MYFSSLYFGILFNFNIKVDIIGLLVGLRHKGVDLIVHYQGSRAIPPRMWAAASFIRIHKDTDELDNPEIKKKVATYELCKLGEIIVDEQYKRGNKYYYVCTNIWCSYCSSF